MRGLIARTFTARRVEALRPVAQRITDGLVDDMVAGPRPAALNEALVLPLAITVLRTQIAVSSTATLRYVIEDIELDGYTIRKGASVLLSIESANVDETVFDDPFTIDIRRTENHHMTFGGGPHYCVGVALAWMDLQITTETLLRRFRDIRLAVPAERLPRSLGGFMEGFTKVPVER